ncbi:biotin-dependent carboxyltransferase family protein [Paenarthrobacter sp. DKR-5]|uniref:5-oxoprolinase subunit C family protein n=1 Tax=Paenarthrobacter sp. DKR-5 TaxID=2835535 RepID=UPI001BDBC8B6|nr:biotin-dependent carboxyltransferase family protein [Paenarthrobacter sp. DKR-5]MBT1001560.1 biotin-dependent carboxyltransferase family protein [Paenarthrobacter sp. DKR-5]
MAFEILEPGLSTTVQDRGRPGYYNVGIPQGGAMDQLSAEMANALAGNTPAQAVLECTYLGPKLRTDSAAVVAVTGAPVEVKVNGEPREEWTRLELAAGDELSFGVIRGGTRFYIAVGGGIDVPQVLGSRSTYGLGAMGGFEGRPLRAGDVVPIGSPPEGAPTGGPNTIEPELRPSFDREVEVRVMVGLYDHRLTDAGLRTLLDSTWTLTPVADRTGLRYAGPAIEWKQRQQPFGAGSDPSNIVDAGYAVGSIQIPGGKEPIVLHRDAVSGGGYAMVATVISADMDLLARSAPGTKTRFRAVTMDEALAARKEGAFVRERIWGGRVDAGSG